MVCYAPSTGTLAVIGVGIYVFWHRTIGHFFGLFGPVLEIAVILGAEVGSAIALVWLSRQIRRRRAASGACTTCRFRCQQALAARPNRLVNVVDRRVQEPDRPALTCHPAAPLLPTPVTSTARRLGPALQRLRPALHPLRVPSLRVPSPRVPSLRGPSPRPGRPLPAPASVPLAAPVATPITPWPRAQLPRGHGAARFMGPVPALFAVRGPVHAPHPAPFPSATRVSSPRPAPAGPRESVDVDGYVITPDGVDATGTPATRRPN